MLRRVARGAVLALWLGAAGTATAQTQASGPCLSSNEAQNVLVVLAPELIQAVGVTCGPRIPATSLLRETDGPFIGKYRAAADGAWGQAAAAIGKLAGPQAAGLLADSTLARPMLGAIAAPFVAQAIKPKDCQTIDRALTALAPLPPRNMAELVVILLQAANADEVRKGNRPKLPICPYEAGR